MEHDDHRGQNPIDDDDDENFFISTVPSHSKLFFGRRRFGYFFFFLASCGVCGARGSASCCTEPIYRSDHVPGCGCCGSAGVGHGCCVVTGPGPLAAGLQRSLCGRGAASVLAVPLSKDASRTRPMARTYRRLYC